MSTPIWLVYAGDGHECEWAEAAWSTREAAICYVHDRWPSYPTRWPNHPAELDYWMHPKWDTGEYPLDENHCNLIRVAPLPMDEPWGADA